MKKIILLTLLAAALVGITYAVKPHPATAPEQAVVKTNPSIEDKTIIFQDYVRYPGKSGKNAFELLQAAAKVEFKKYDFGVFVESINGVKPDSKHFWKLYVNGKESQVGADSAETNNGDVIEWKLEEVK